MKGIFDKNMHKQGPCLLKNVSILQEMKWNKRKYYQPKYTDTKKIYRYKESNGEEVWGSILKRVSSFRRERKSS